MALSIILGEMEVKYPTLGVDNHQTEVYIKSIGDSR